MPAESHTCPQPALRWLRRPIVLTVLLSAVLHVMLFWLIFDFEPVMPDSARPDLHESADASANVSVNIALQRAPAPESSGQPETSDPSDPSEMTFTQPSSESLPATGAVIVADYTSERTDPGTPAPYPPFASEPFPENSAEAFPSVSEPPASAGVERLWLSTQWPASALSVPVNPLERAGSTDSDGLSPALTATLAQLMRWPEMPSQPIPASPAEAQKSASTQVLTEGEIAALEPGILEWIEALSRSVDASAASQLEYEGQVYELRTDVQPATDPTGLDRVLLEISTRRNGEVRRSVVEARRTAFSHFAKFVNQWDADVSLADDWVGGRFHSNSPINLAERGPRPVFAGPVTVAARQSVARRVRESPMFAAGLETGVRHIPLPRDIALPGADEMDDTVRLYFFDEHTEIVFEAHGGMSWRSAGGEQQGRLTMGENMTYLIARDNVQLMVQGTVNGRVLVYSPRRILIQGNLVYAQDPVSNPMSGDFLGLVSEGSVEVAESSVTGPGDLNIQAAIFARSRFSVRRFRDRPQGVLQIFGSLTAGSVSATEPRFSTRVEHDERLLDRRPPSFPVTGNYELAAWDRQWHVEQ